MVIAKMMRAVLLTGQGGFEQLHYRQDVPVPVPQAGEVLIRVAAAAINNTDINLRINWYGKEGDPASGDAVQAGQWSGGEVLKFPRIQGADVCGEVVSVGSGVEGARIGSRVIVDPVMRAPSGYFGADCDGGFAEYAVVRSANAHTVTSSLSDVELASFPCSYSTAENLLTRARVCRGDRVVVTGASGGVGSAVVQLAHWRGAEVIAIAQPHKAAELYTLGAVQVESREANLVARLGSNSVDVVIDLVGGLQWPMLIDVLRHHGRYACSGAIAGAIVPLDLRSFYFKDLTLYGCTSYEPEVFRTLVKHIEAGRVVPLVAQTYPLNEIIAAQTAFLEKRHVGKIVLKVCQDV